MTEKSSPDVLDHPLHQLLDELKHLELVAGQFSVESVGEESDYAAGQAHAYRESASKLAAVLIAWRRVPQPELVAKLREAHRECLMTSGGPNFQQPADDFEALLEAVGAAPPAPQACINCNVPFDVHEVRGYWGKPLPSGAHEVGPFCERCYSLIKTHEAAAPAPQPDIHAFVDSLPDSIDRGLVRKIDIENRLIEWLAAPAPQAQEQGTQAPTK